MYHRTCEELFIVGHRKEGVYMIDIDGNGPHPPAYVFCDMANELTTTTIITNLPQELVTIEFLLYFLLLNLLLKTRSAAYNCINRLFVKQT